MNFISMLSPQSLFSNDAPKSAGPEGFATARSWLPLMSMIPTQYYSGGPKAKKFDMQTLTSTVFLGRKLDPVTVRAELVGDKPVYRIEDGHHRIETLRLAGYQGLVLADVWYRPEDFPEYAADLEEEQTVSAAIPRYPQPMGMMRRDRTPDEDEEDRWIRVENVLELPAPVSLAKQEIPGRRLRLPKLIPVSILSRFGQIRKKQHRKRDRKCPFVKFSDFSA